MSAWLRIRPLPAAILALALAGMGISAYLTSQHFADRPPICGGLGSCATVQQSEYSEMAGIPVALLGLGAYAFIAVLVVARDRWPLADTGLLAASFVGVLYSVYLTWVELAILHAVCLWCAASAVVITLIAGLALLLVLRPQPVPAGYEYAEL